MSPVYAGRGALDDGLREGVHWSFSLEQPHDPLCTIGRPGGDKAPIGFAQRLG